MKRFVVYMLILFITVFGCIAAVNYTVDPGHVYSDKYEQEIALGLKSGKNVTNIGNFDDRFVKRELIEFNRDNRFDVVVMGSSRVIQIDSEAFPNQTRVLNLGVTAGQLEDFIAFYQLLKENNVSYNTLILGIEPTLFNREFGYNTLWETNEQYYYSYSGIQHKDSNKWKDKIVNLFSATYFNSSIDALRTPTEKLELTDSRFNSNMTICTDGARLYGNSFYERNQNAINDDAMTWMHESYSRYPTISNENHDKLLGFINVLQNNGVKVFFFCSPYHPLFYNRMINLGQNRKAIDIIYEIRREKDIRIIGKYKAEECGADESWLLDASHPTYKTIKRLILSI